MPGDLSRKRSEAVGRPRRDFLWVSSCSQLRHDEVLKIIVFGMMRKLGLLDSFVKLRDFKPPKARTWVRKGGDVVFTTDAEVQTTNKVQYNKPDIFVKDSRSKKIIIGDSLLNTA